MSATVAAMTGTMVHRGPDANGLWSDPDGRCVLGHRRLSIIDTSAAGAQPMVSGDGRHVITFNGEIYNYLELRPTLEALGRRLRGRTDTEVLLEGMAEWGVDALLQLDGMFAFALFDTRSGELTLARDPFGEKPLYYTVLKSGAVAFASELQALERCPGFDARVDVSAMAEVLSFQYVGAPRSIYTSVKKLAPGHWLRIDRAGNIRTGRYFAYRPGSTGFTRRDLPDLAEELEDILLRSISRRMISDVPLGAFLSGGVDSSTVCALIRRKLGRPLKTFSMGFLDEPESEHQIARAFAEHLGTEHYEQVLTPDASGFLTDIGAMLDEPNADSSCLPTYLLSKFAREHVTVSISGDGGDEMFGGYGRYFATLDELERRRTGEIGESWTPGGVYYGSRILVSLETQVEELFGFVPEAYAEHLSSLRALVDDNSDELLCEMRRTDAENYMPGAVLPKVDRMSMQCSLEVRTPFLNMEVARFAERLPQAALVDGMRGKLVLREIAYRYLPRDLIDLPKRGFGLPLSDWARASHLEAASHLLESDDSRIAAVFGAAGIARFLKRQRTEGQFSPYQVWGAAMLESWLRHHPVELPVLSGADGAARARVWASGPVQTDEVEPPDHDSSAGLISTETTDGRVAAAKSLQLAASALGPGLFAVRELPAACEVKSDVATSDGEFSMPEVGAMPTGLDAIRLEALQGSTLIFTESAVGRRVGYRECEQLARLGVRRALMLGGHDDRVVDLAFNARRGLSRATAALRLFSRRAAIVSNNPALRLLGAKPFTCDGDMLRSGEIHAIDPLPDCELSDRFLVFEGLRQLPPVGASHADIREQAGGRYSIWNQRLFFSPTDRIRTRKPYWLVRADEASRRLATMSQRTQSMAGFDPSVGGELLARLVSRPVREEFALKPGDPVVVCTHGLPSGGAERQWVYLAQSLKDRGYDVTFVVTERLGDAPIQYLSMLRRSAIPVMDGAAFTTFQQLKRWPKDSPVGPENLGSLPMPSELLTLVAAFVEIGPKAVFLQLDQPNVVGATAALIADTPRIILSFRNYNPTHLPQIFKPWMKPAYEILAKSHRVLLSGNHQGANDDYADWLGLRRERVAYIPNAVNPAEFAPPSARELQAVHRELGVEETTPILLGVFRLSPEKDPFGFLEVCAKTMAAVPEARGFIAGVGPMHDEMQARIHALGLTGRIRLLGERDDVNVLMRMATVFVLASRTEGTPNVLMEAELTGTAVVATDAGGTRDVVDSRSGVVRPVGDIAGLAEAVVALLNDPDRARGMGQAGRERMLAEFPKYRLAERYARLAQGLSPDGPELEPTPTTLTAVG